MIELLTEETRRVHEEMVEAVDTGTLEDYSVSDTLCGACAAASELLIRRLRAKGLPAERIVGYSEYGWRCHVWVRVGDFHCDPTYMQFDDDCITDGFWVGREAPMTPKVASWAPEGPAFQWCSEECPVRVLLTAGLLEEQPANTRPRGFWTRHKEWVAVGG